MTVCCEWMSTGDCVMREYGTWGKCMCANNRWFWLVFFWVIHYDLGQIKYDLGQMKLVGAKEPLYRSFHDNVLLLSFVIKIQWNDCLQSKSRSGSKERTWFLHSPYYRFTCSKVSFFPGLLTNCMCRKYCVSII